MAQQVGDSGVLLSSLQSQDALGEAEVLALVAALVEVFAEVGVPVEVELTQAFGNLEQLIQL